MNVVDVMGFAGGFTLGAVQAGFQLTGKFEEAGAFGARNMEVNRHILGDNWELQEGNLETWKPVSADLVVANPPCSAFSSMSYGQKNTIYGMENRINECMWNVMRIGGKIAPKILIMESVQAAAVSGLPLMRKLRDELESVSGKKYYMTHVIQNNGSLGGASIRRRYFLVLSQMPFSVDLPTFGPPPTLGDTILDLEGLNPYIPDAQMYPEDMGVYVKGNLRGKNSISAWVRENVFNWQGVVDGHMTTDPTTNNYLRAIDLMDEEPIDDEGGTWPQNRCMVVAMRRYYAKHGKLPDRWHTKNKHDKWVDEELIKANMEMGWNRPKRWDSRKVAHVVTGAAMYYVLHPTQKRFLTNRECARILGFPDNWLIEPNKNAKGLEAWWGKGVSVQSGKWICDQARMNLAGETGDYLGTLVSDHGRLAKHGVVEREKVIDVSAVPKHAVLTAVETEVEEDDAA